MTTQRDLDLAMLAAGHETGRWNENGHPAPWPDDFFNPHTEWRPDTSPANEPQPGQPPF